jgi:hypothetical protein
MSNQIQTSIQLDVPYFQQTRLATCGPAALMMILKYYDPSYELTRKNETKLWRQSRSLIILGATLQYRLATLAKQHGYIAEIHHQTHMHTSLEKLLSRSAKKAQIPITYNPDITTLIPQALKNKIPPLILLNLQPINQENVYHWLVITGINTKHFIVNDPYIPLHQQNKQRKNIPIPYNIFHQALNSPCKGSFHFPSAAILIHK